MSDDELNALILCKSSPDTPTPPLNSDMFQHLRELYRVMGSLNNVWREQACEKANKTIPTWLPTQNCRGHSI